MVYEMNKSFVTKALLMSTVLMAGILLIPTNIQDAKANPCAGVELYWYWWNWWRWWTTGPAGNGGDGGNRGNNEFGGAGGNTGDAGDGCRRWRWNK